MKIEDLIRIEVPPIWFGAKIQGYYIRHDKKWTTFQGEWEWKEMRGRGNVRREVAHVIDFIFMEKGRKIQKENKDDNEMEENICFFII